MVENLDRLISLNNKLKNKIQHYKQIKISLDMHGIEDINGISIQDKDVKKHISNELKLVAIRKIEKYEELATKLSLNVEDLDHVEKQLEWL